MANKVKPGKVRAAKAKAPRHAKAKLVEALRQTGPAKPRPIGPRPTKPLKGPPKGPRKDYTSSERMAKIFAALDQLFPRAECALKHQNAFQLLVATILSAQCTDERVNKVTPELFRKHPTPQDLAALRPEALEPEILARSDNERASPAGVGHRRQPESSAEFASWLGC